jgi:site-specific DNA-methyltransferase (adenine-specific)
VKNKKRRKQTRTSSFGAPGRESHDSSSFYTSNLYKNLPSEQPVKYYENKIPKKYLNRVFHESAENMKELPDSSVHLAISSPPYNIGKDYDKNLSLNDYLEMLNDVWKEIMRVLAPGGRMCINIANLGRKPYIPLHAFVINDLINLGFLMRGEIIWDKSASAGSSTAWGSWKSSSNPTLRDVHEYILIFSKSHFKREKIEERPNTITRDEFLENTKSVWTFPTVSAKKIGHPAPFPIELPYRIIQLYSYKDEIVLDPFMGCYDDQSEVLTENGFKLFENIKKSDKIAYLENGLLRFIQPTRRFKYKYEGEMYFLKSRSVDLAITPNHNLYCKEFHKSQFTLEPVSDINYYSFNIKSNCKWEGEYKEQFLLPGTKIKTHQNTTKWLDSIEIKMEDWLEFFGIYLADGSVTKVQRYNKKTGNPCGSEYQISIKQMKSESRAIIREILKKLPFNFVEGLEYFRIYNFQLYTYLKQFGKNNQKFIPHNIKNLCKDQLKILFDSLILGDGSISPNGQIQYYTSSPILRDDICELILKLGNSPTVYTRGEKTTIYQGRTILSKESYAVCVRQSKNLKLYKNKHIRIDQYSGYVYCVEVPSHVIYVRRNGKCCWCGNSGQTAIAALKAGRKYIGYEIEKEYVDLANKRINEYIEEHRKTKLDDFLSPSKGS